MTATCDFQPVAIGGSANVDSQATFLASSYLDNGFTTGTAQSSEANKLWRQACFVSASLAQFICNSLAENVSDNGDQAGFLTQMGSCIPTLPGANTWAGSQTFNAGITVNGAKSTLAASVAGYASLNLPHGATPTTLANGDIWTTTSGFFVRISGVTWQMPNLNGANTWSQPQTFNAGITANVTGSVSGSSGSCTGNAASATTAANCTGNAASATTAANCTGNAATATTAASCSGNSATASAILSMPAKTFAGNNAAGSANSTAMSVAQAVSLLGLASNGVATFGSVVIPTNNGNIIVNWGKETGVLAGANSALETFPTPFPSGGTAVCAPIGGGSAEVIFLSSSQIQVKNTGSGTIDIGWIAIGR